VLRVLTTARVAEIFGRSEHTIRQMAARGQLPYRKLGRRLILLESEITSHACLTTASKN
jgi:hypothetical protein